MKNLLFQAARGGYAVPAFNFYNLESLGAILSAAAELRAPVILAASESAIKYMGDDFLRWVAGRRKMEDGRRKMENGKGRGGKASAASSFFPLPSSLHLDHGRSFEACTHAIALGFDSVMIDGSGLPFDENVKLTRCVVEYAHKRGVFVEAELGMLGGVEEPAPDGAADAPRSEFTDPEQARRFVNLTGCDSLAVAIGTSHGAYKRMMENGKWKRENGKIGGSLAAPPFSILRFDVLKEIRARLPRTPLVLHGASQIPEKYAKVLGLRNAGGIPPAEIRRAVRLGIAKVNVDSDARLAWTATMKKMFCPPESSAKIEFDPRHYLAAASKEMTELYKKEIKLIRGK